MELLDNSLLRATENASLLGGNEGEMGRQNTQLMKVGPVGVELTARYDAPTLEEGAPSVPTSDGLESDSGRAPEEAPPTSGLDIQVRLGSR